MLEIDENIDKKFPFINNPVLKDKNLIRDYWKGKTRQIISNVNINPEDFVLGEESYRLCELANEELVEMLNENLDIFYSALAMIPMNNIDGALKLMKRFIVREKTLAGVQLFTRALGKSIADKEFEKIFSYCSENKIPIWLHPVFDDRKPDNNIIFSWEYELSQAMLEIVKEGYFKKYPNLKIIVHHAGAMIPYFSERINNILPRDLACDFKKFYVDTALLGNAKAIELAIEYFGIEKVLFGTDAPFGIEPAGASREIISAIWSLKLETENEEKIFYGNIKKLLED